MFEFNRTLSPVCMQTKNSQSKMIRNIPLVSYSIRTHNLIQLNKGILLDDLVKGYDGNPVITGS